MAVNRPGKGLCYPRVLLDVPDVGTPNNEKEMSRGLSVAVTLLSPMKRGCRPKSSITGCTKVWDRASDKYAVAQARVKVSELHF